MGQLEIEMVDQFEAFGLSRLLEVEEVGQLEVVAP